MKKFICIHGHFYQPPRENAWLEEIELQESAEPYHDWNERITAECYMPNSASRILDGEGKIVDIVNNYAKISFNFGPTLLSWMKDYAPKTYQAILEGDKESVQNFNGHGSAIAQVYNHLIMPLANRRDKETQIIWGIEDFKSRFHREPEGIWLAETAVDLETLELLVEHNIKYTILAPNQVNRFRRIGENDWHEGVDPRKHYYCNLPSGKKIVLFVYDGGVSQAVAFKGLLKDGKEFANHLMGAYNAEDTETQLVHIATDGESYGHHHRHGDMALAYCLRHIEELGIARITNYSEFLSLFEPEHEIEIHEDSSWSCAHGVERWRSNCGCNTGGRPGWTQEWRFPLREALDWLRDELIPIYEEEMRLYNDQPWELRNKYIQILLNRDSKNVESFLKENSKVSLSDLGKTRFMRLLEMQRQSLLMFTSCAWFFDEISGIETVQVLQYANRAIQLAEQVSDKALEAKFLEKLSEATSNIPDHEDGANIYRLLTGPSRLTLTKVGMHYAVASLFAEQPHKISVLNYAVDNQYFERMEAGLQRLAIGRTTVYSKITLSQKYFSFAVIYLGQHQIIGGSTNKLSRKDFNKMAEEIKAAFNTSNIADVLQIMREYFPSKNFSIWDLFKDERAKVLNKILGSSLKAAENTYQTIYEKNYNLMNVMHSANLQIPNILKQNLDIVINKSLEAFFSSGSLNTNRLLNLARDVKKWNIPLNQERIALVAEVRLHELISEYYMNTTQLELLRKVNEILMCLNGLHVDLNLNEIQNLVLRMVRKLIPTWREDMKVDNGIIPLLGAFLKLCELTNLKVDVSDWINHKSTA